jgi:hypothetical protein
MPKVRQGVPIKSMFCNAPSSRSIKSLPKNQGSSSQSNSNTTYTFYQFQGLVSINVFIARKDPSRAICWSRARANAFNTIYLPTSNIVTNRQTVKDRSVMALAHLQSLGAL